MLTTAALLGEFIVLAFLFAGALGASASLVQDATASDVRPGAELGYGIGLWVVPVLVGAMAAWRKYWVIVGVQLCVLLWVAWLWS